MDSILSDVRSAARLLGRRPLFAVVTILILAAGIAANTAMFSIVSAVLLRPLPFAEPDQLVTVGEARRGVVGDGLVSLPVLLAWRERQGVVELAGYNEGTRILTGGDPIDVNTALVSGNFFDLLGEPIAIGRAFRPDEDVVGAPRVLIIGHALWRTRFAADSGVIGRAITIENVSYTITGVTRPGFDFPTGAQLWTPLLPPIPPDILTIPSWKYMRVIGRLDPGVSIERAEQQLGAIAASIPRNADWGARARSLRDSVTGDVRAPLRILMAAVALVLLVACANVGSLLLARGVARRRELAIRAALGGSRARIARFLMAESLLIACAAGILGTLAAWWTLDLLVRSSPTELPRLAQAAIDWRVLIFALGASLITGLVTGVLPALRSGTSDVTTGLRDGGHSSTGRASGRLRAALVVSEIALSLILLTGAGLLVRSFVAMMAVDPGFRPGRVVAFEIRPPNHCYRDWSAWHGFFVELTARARAIPGVVSAATARNLPLSGSPWSLPIVTDSGPASFANLAAQIAGVSPGFLRTMGIRLVSGRDFEARDETGSVPVALVNEAFARTFFRGENPVGRRARPYFGGPTMRQIVGVVADVHHTALASGPEPAMYMLAAQDPFGPLTLVVRSGVSVEALVPAVRSIVRDIDPDQPISSVRTMDEMISESVARPRFYASLLGGFAVVAVILAMVGLYALMAQLLAQRVPEIAVRMALGARPVDVFRLLAGQGMRLAIAGAVLGVLGSLAATPVLSSLLFGIRPTDALTLIVAAVFVVIVAAGATSVHALRASRLDPGRILRS